MNIVMPSLSVVNEVFNPVDVGVLTCTVVERFVEELEDVATLDFVVEVEFMFVVVSVPKAVDCLCVVPCVPKVLLGVVTVGKM